MIEYVTVVLDWNMPELSAIFHCSKRLPQPYQGESLVFCKTIATAFPRRIVLFYKILEKHSDDTMRTDV